MVDHSAENKQTKQQQQNYVILVIISLSHSNITQLEISVNVIYCWRIQNKMCGNSIA